MKHLVTGLLIASGAAVLAVGVLAGVEMLLSNPKRSRRQLPVGPLKEEAPASPARKFSIKRTKSEVGFVYWILEGFGRYKCFVLCDTWQEAMTQAQAKVEETDAVFAASL